MPMFTRAINAVGAQKSPLHFNNSLTLHLPFDGSIGNASFYRSSTAWNPDTLASAAANTPRFVNGRNGKKAILIEEASTNYFLNSSSTSIPATQTINLSASLAAGHTSSGYWTCSVTGPGQVVATNVSATVTGLGTATAGSPNTFRVTGAGNVLFTVSGATSATRVQVEPLPHATSFIETAGGTVSRTAENMFHPNLTYKDSVFSSFKYPIDTGWGDQKYEFINTSDAWVKVGTQSSIASGIMNIKGNGEGYYLNFIADNSSTYTFGFFTKITYRVTRLAGQLYVYGGAGTGTQMRIVTAVGTYTDYIYSPSTAGIRFIGNTAAADIDIDNFRVYNDPCSGTVAAWVNVIPSVTAVVTGNSYTLTPSVFSVETGNNIITLRNSDSNAWMGITGTTTGQQNQAPATGQVLSGWHHFAMTYGSAATVRVYIDGVQQAVNTVGDLRFPLNYPTNFVIGAAGSSGAYAYTHLNMPIQDFRVYNKTLTAKEIQTLYTLS